MAVVMVDVYPGLFHNKNKERESSPGCTREAGAGLQRLPMDLTVFPKI